MQPLPPFLDENHKSKQAFLRHADDLAAKGELSTQEMAHYVNTKIVPSALKTTNDILKERDMPLRTCSEFLRSFGLLRGRPTKKYDDSDDESVTESRVLPESEDISEGTIWRWLKMFGYRYDVARKHFYNDTHEHPMTIEDRSRFVR